MATSSEWKKLLDARYPSYKVEVRAFLDSLDVSNSNEISAEKVDAIKFDEDVDDNLKLLYSEAIYGSDKEVKARIKNRMANFKRGLM